MLDARITFRANHHRNSCAFTLVELLIVIGVIALLIGILVPALQKARQQANMLFCQSNLLAIGQMCATYAAGNNGWYPMACQDPGQMVNYAGVLTLEMQNPKNPIGATGLQQWMPQDYLPVFHDVDVPPMPWGVRATAYVANSRAMGSSPVADYSTYNPKTFKVQAMHARKVGSIVRSAEVMFMWDGACDVTSGQFNAGSPYIFSWTLDNFGELYSHGLGFPSALSGTIGSWNPKFYPNLIALGEPATNATTHISSFTGGATLAYLTLENRDPTKPNNFSGQNGGVFVCEMRFRHYGNTTANFLFADGHVDSRKLGTVTAKDICLNK
jgi:prepilin-type processing-associated H-X9-DG protein